MMMRAKSLSFVAFSSRAIGKPESVTVPRNPR